MQKRFARLFRVFIISIIFIVPIFLINIKYISAGTLKGEAESYRERGYKAQQAGDIDAAITWYQKSANLDPDYAAPHNDLGILYEAKGWLDRAESEYQKAFSIDPDYAKAHTNLALLYERKGELEKAAFHWMRRYKLGQPGDPWTEEARQRLEKIGLLEKKDTGKTPPPGIEQQTGREEPKKRLVPKKKKQSKMEKRKKETAVRPKRSKDISDEWTLVGPKPERARSAKEEREFVSKRPKKTISRPSSREKQDMDKELQESLRLAEERLRQERSKNTDTGIETGTRPNAKTAESMSAARGYYVKANDYYRKGEYSRALDELRTAKKMYPADPALLKLEESIKNSMKEERIKDHYNEGMMLYHKDNFSGARKEFEAILKILPE